MGIAERGYGIYAIDACFGNDDMNGKQVFCI